MEGQMSFTDLDATWCGKTSPEHCPQMTEKTSAPSSKKQQGSKIRLPLFLDLRENGQTRDASWVMGGPLLGEYMTHSFGESPKEENVSRLSQILEDTARPKYSLSEKACLGILKRAKKHGKELPPALQEALEQQCNMGVTFYNQRLTGEIAKTLNSAATDSDHIPVTIEMTSTMNIIGCYQNTGRGWWNESDIGATIRTPCGGDAIKANIVIEGNYGNESNKRGEWSTEQYFNVGNSEHSRPYARSADDFDRGGTA